MSGKISLFDEVVTLKNNFISLKDGNDLSIPAGRLIANVASYETEAWAERIDAIVKAGAPAGGEDDLVFFMMPVLQNRAGELLARDGLHWRQRLGLWTAGKLAAMAHERCHVRTPVLRPQLSANSRASFFVSKPM